MYKVILEKDASVGTALKAAWNVGGKAMNLLGKLFMPLTVISMGKDLIQGAPKEVSVKQDPDMLRGNLKFAELSPVTFTGSDGMVKVAVSFRDLFAKVKTGVKNFFVAPKPPGPTTKPGQGFLIEDVGARRIKRLDEIPTNNIYKNEKGLEYKGHRAIVGKRDYGMAYMPEGIVGEGEATLPRWTKKLLLNQEKAGVIVDLKNPFRYEKRQMRAARKMKNRTPPTNNTPSSPQADPRVKHLEETLGKERAERVTAEKGWAEKLKQTEVTLGETQAAKEALEAQVKEFKNPTFGQSLKQTWVVTPQWGKGMALAGAGVAAGALLTNKDKKEEKKEQSMFRLG